VRMDFKRQRELYNQCNPDEPLWPDDPRNVNVDQDGGVRGVRWSDEIAKRIEFSKVPVCELFTGLRGTGKSTELRRLLARLGDPKRANLLTVLVDADDVLDLTQEIDVSDLLSFVLYGAEAEVLRKEGKDPRDRGDGPFKRLWTWLTTTDVELAKVSAEPFGVGFELDFRHNPTLRARVRATVSNHLSSFVKRVREELVALEERAKAAGFAGLFVLFDSLEKLRGSSANWIEVLASAERVFGGGAMHVALPVHVLYTVPPALFRRVSDPPISFMPMIKVRSQDGEVHKPGMDVIIELITRRIPSDALAELFGEGKERERIRQIGLWAGGYPREIIRVLQAVLVEEQFPVSFDQLEKVLFRSGIQYRGIAHGSGALAWLGSVARNKKLVTTPADAEAADFLLGTNLIIRYLNDDEWFDVHPAIAGLPELAEPQPPSKPS
jgi:hypothetical protein